MKNATTLIAQLRSNAVEAFDLLIEQYGDRLYWHIRRIVVQHEEAEDVESETEPEATQVCFRLCYIALRHQIKMP